MYRSTYLSLVVPALLAIVLLPLAARLTHRPHQAAKPAPAAATAVTTAEATADTTPTVETLMTADTTAAEASPPDKTTVMLGGGPVKVKLTPEEQRFVELANKERKDRNLPELIVAPLLVETARAKSKEMHDLKYWGHESPDKKRRTAMYRVLAALSEQPKSMLVGENLYYCTQVLVDSGHVALMSSPSHRKNILNPEYRYIGVGAYIADNKRFWVTEHFLQIDY